MVKIPIVLLKAWADMGHSLKFTAQMRIQEEAVRALASLRDYNLREAYYMNLKAAQQRYERVTDENIQSYSPMDVRDASIALAAAHRLFSTVSRRKRSCIRR